VSPGDTRHQLIQCRAAKAPVHDPKEDNTMSHIKLNPANVAQPKRVAIVISNPGVSTTTGWPVGFWRAELSYPQSPALAAAVTSRERDEGGCDG
jgi:hypothetical protein